MFQYMMSSVATLSWSPVLSFPHMLTILIMQMFLALCVQWLVILVVSGTGIKVIKLGQKHHTLGPVNIFLPLAKHGACKCSLTGNALGGFRLRFKNKFQDYVMRKLFETWLQENRRRRVAKAFIVRSLKRLSCRAFTCSPFGCCKVRVE